jgi:hypothetical protein
MRKHLSRFQLAANQRNGHLSTGPKTPTGIAVSKMNAVKHGLRTREVILRGRCIRENPREFEVLRQQLWDDLKPEGALEEILAEQIVITYWRLRRVPRAESGEIVLNVDNRQWHREKNEPFGLSFWIGCSLAGNADSKLQNSYFGNSYLNSCMETLLASVQKEGKITEAVFKNLVDSLGGKPNLLTTSLERFRSQILQNQEGLPPSEIKERTVAHIREKIRSISWASEKCRKRDQMEEEARQAADVLPSAETLEKILRYESALQKKLYRAMNHLERLQRRRKGENVPAPVAMEISTGV